MKYPVCLTAFAATCAMCLAPANAATVMPCNYEMLNGESTSSGRDHFWDTIYNGLGDPMADLSLLSGGMGKLTDGVIGAANWFVDAEPYVGWRRVDPTIRFRFNGKVTVDTVTLYVDDSNGKLPGDEPTEFSGGVFPPSAVVLMQGTKSLTFDNFATNPAHTPLTLDLPTGGWAGNLIDVKLVRAGPPPGLGYQPWVFLSEALFTRSGAPPIPTPVPIPTPAALWGGMALFGLATLWSASRPQI
jgi:hypothetical protein